MDASMLDLVPTLRALVDAEGLKLEAVSVPIESDGHGKIRVLDKHSVPLHDGARTVRWQVPSLSELFRGNRMPPSDMDHYPEDYREHFFVIEAHVLTLCKARRDPTDQEMEEIYSMLRRRPEGRSLGATHDFMWQAAALLLGTHVLSAAEFEALIGALERSTRKWALRPVSRNYVAYLHQTFEAGRA